jgi:hypothetical protein
MLFSVLFVCLGNLEKEIKDKYSDSDVNTIWNLLKNEIHQSVTENKNVKIALEYLNIFLGFGWYLLKEVIHSI